jgi:hypothetical protein
MLQTLILLFALAAPAHKFTINDKSTAPQAVINDLVRQLTAQHFVRVKTLDTQCCAIQLQTTTEPGVLRITILDIDGQSVYTGKYQSVKAALADPDFIKSLSRP